MSQREIYQKWHASPEKIKERSQRVLARRAMVKEHGAAALAGKDVHHKSPISSGGGNGTSNLGVMSVKQNRGAANPRHRKGQ